MIEAEDFIQPAKALGFNTWAGVPCSFLSPFVNRIISDPEMTYISSANEGDAVATASGAALAGRPAVAMMQNSGLGNAVSPLSSLNWVFRIPILLIITLRGESGMQDEPQHELMGQITAGMLDQLQIPWTWFPRSAAEVEGALMVACWHMEKTARPYAFIMRHGSVAPGTLNAGWSSTSVPKLPADGLLSPGAALLTRQQALQCVIEQTSETESVVIGTTGYTGRELFALADRANHLYMVGSMGCAASFGLGMSLALPARQIVVVDGDGAALMRMGNFATCGAYGGANFLHLLLDNSMHESTGGQPTVSASVSFAAVAGACGYREARAGVTLDALRKFLTETTGPGLLHLRICKGVPASLPRPNMRPHQVRTRLMQSLGVTTAWMNT